MAGTYAVHVDDPDMSQAYDFTVDALDSSTAEEAGARLAIACENEKVRWTYKTRGLEFSAYGDRPAGALVRNIAGYAVANPVI